MRVPSLALALLAAAPAAAAADRFVDVATGSDTGPNADCRLDTAPCKTIAHALALADLAPGDRVLVGPGTYSVATGERFPLVVPPGVELVGTAGPAATLVEDADASATSPYTVRVTLDGPLSDPTGIEGFSIDGLGIAENLYGVWIESIAEEPAPGGPAPHARDLFVKGFSEGIALAAWGCCPSTTRGRAWLGATVERCIVEGTGTGVAVRAIGDDGSTLAVDASTIRNVVVRGAGRGILLQTVEGLLGPAGVASIGTTLRHVTVVDATGDGITLDPRDAAAGRPAIAIELASSVVTRTGGYGVREETGDGSARWLEADVAGLWSNVFHANALGAYYDLDTARAYDTDAEVASIPDLAGASGANRVVDPLVDATGHLLPGSPCVDRADPVRTAPDDVDGEPRPSGAGPDVGADEASGLLRGVFTGIAPPVPDKAQVFGSLAPYPATAPPFADPEPAVLSNGTKPLVVYALVADGPSPLLAAKDAAADTVVLYW